MYENAVPVFEMKNKLSFFLHKAESEGPVFISNRGKPAFVLQTIEDYEEQKQTDSKEKSVIDIVAALRKKHDLSEEDFANEDLTDFFDSLRDHSYKGPTNPEHLFD